MPLADAPGAPTRDQAPGTVDAHMRRVYWRRTSGLMWTMLAIWFVASFLIHAFAVPLNQIRFLGFPLGFYMAAQGSLIVFVVMLFWFAARQNRIDEECGVSED